MVICLERGADLHLPLPLTVSCFSKIQIGFTFLVPAHTGSPGQRAIKRVRVCVCVCACARARVRVWASARATVLLGLIALILMVSEVFVAFGLSALLFWMVSLHL